ncbi:aspartyl-phosphate phosphatase Spo0E family protein [Paenibacillus agricola]|uniref:Aspartyl-phosphate phosphatase Spo0E family protein n=1 Tax=Paenibacillus agricola TaxID=2716264 RepID=A0ABX0J332_9BACL|nr:aspartyl-phosphate phosphatase Spo0E family protein [Paenibacillus agricola]NHN29277.1 aspartyl-phosphate phosphatase Spo0E family protein [Paenibacillus agricola]
MAFPEYQLRQYRRVGWIRENDEQAKWSFRTRKQVSDIRLLEEEIDSLRRQLELMVLTNKSLSSPEIVEFSMILDKKINEYMNQNRKNR